MRYVISVLSVFLLIFICTSSTVPITNVSLHDEKNFQIIDASVTPLSVDAAITSNNKNFCPPDMIEIEGDYCPDVLEICLKWVDRKGNAVKEAIPGPGESGRCGEWKQPTICLSDKKIHKHYCIDKYEYPNKYGQRPASWKSWNDMKTACAGEGKRMCKKHEWAFACEGPDMKPYPYGDGYHRDSTICNIDKSVPKGLDVMKVATHDSEGGRILDSMLSPSGSMPNCVSTFGVYDMVGNIDEWVVNESGRPYQGSFMSGHIFGVRNACRPSTDGHNETFAWYESGSRCCRDVE